MTVSFRRRRHCPYLAPQNTTTTSLDATRLFSIPIWRGTKTSEQVQVKDFFRAISQQWICLSETSINLPFSELDRGRKKACTKNTALHSAPQLQGLFTIVHVPDEWWDVWTRRWKAMLFSFLSKMLLKKKNLRTSNNRSSCWSWDFNLPIRKPRTCPSSRQRSRCCEHNDGRRATTTTTTTRCAYWRVVVDEKAVGLRKRRQGKEGRDKEEWEEEIEKVKEIEMMKDEGGDELSFLGIGMCIQTGLIEKKRGKNFGPCYSLFLDWSRIRFFFFLYQIGGGEEPNRVYNYKWDTIVSVYEHTHTLSLPCFRRQRGRVPKTEDPRVK